MEEIATLFSECSPEFEINLIYIILEYMYNMMYWDVIKELKYTSIIYESPSFLRSGEIIYDIVWVKRSQEKHLALYQIYIHPVLENYNTLSYLYDDRLFEETDEQREYYHHMYKAHFLINL